MAKEYKDRFTEAEKELSEKSAFICETCNVRYGKKDAEKKNNTCCDRTLKELTQEAFGP